MENAIDRLESPLLQLPCELRRMIYEFVVKRDGPIPLIRKRPSSEPSQFRAGYWRMKDDHRSAWEHGIGLFYVSKQVSDEALGLFYEVNWFHIADPWESVVAFFKNYETLPLGRIRKLYFKMVGKFLHPAGCPVRQNLFHGLRELRIRVCARTGPDAQFGPLPMFGERKVAEYVVRLAKSVDNQVKVLFLRTDSELVNSMGESFLRKHAKHVRVYDTVEDLEDGM